MTSSCSTQRLKKVVSGWVKVFLLVWRQNIIWTRQLYCIMYHWDWVAMAIYSKIPQFSWVSIDSDIKLSSSRRQAIIWTLDGLLLIGRLETSISENVFIKTQNFSFMEMILKISSVKLWPFYPGWDELTHCGLVTPYGDKDLGQYWLR